MFRFLCLLLICLHTSPSTANSSNIVNVYTWSQEIPSTVIKQFEKETGIQVNYTSFDSNEAMYAKIRIAKNNGYDLIEPSSYYVDRMRQQNMLEKLDRAQLSEFKNLDPLLLNQNYDPQSAYSVPFIWGITGIFVNQNDFTKMAVTHWSDLLKKEYANQLMMLDDPREAFSIALLLLGYSINDTNPQHIQSAYLKLRELLPNIRMFNTDAVRSIIIDEDAPIGIVWNGDLFKASLENPKVMFVYPQDHFEIWVDNFVILKSAPHKENAYRFLNFLLRPDIAKEVSLDINYATANLAARHLLPPDIRNNPILYPPKEVLRRGEFEKDIGDTTFALYEKYWEQLKMDA